MSEPYWEPLAAAPVAVVAVGTTLPAVPVDGMEAILVNSLTAPIYVWRFRYLASITDAYKWLFVGGSPVSDEVQAGESAAGGAAWIDLATVGPQVTVPRAGIYNIEYSAIGWSNTAGADIYVAAKLGALATSQSEGQESRQPSASQYHTQAGFVPRRTLLANDVVKLQYNSFGTTGSWKQRRLFVTPLRVA